MKSKRSASLFPSIYLRITEKPFGAVWESKLKKPALILSAVAVFVIIVVMAFWIAVFGMRIYKYYAYVQDINNQRQEIQAKINFWQSVADKYTGYKDAYFQMAVLEYQLGEIDKAKQDNQRSLLLDPNFDDARKLELVLDKQ